MTIAELDPRLTFESFVVGPANRLASAAARRAADSPGTSYNPLFIYSDPGLGKSHVLVAIAHRARKVNPDLRIGYVPIELFLQQFASGPSAGTLDGIKARLGDLDIVLLDDVHLLRGHDGAQEVIHDCLDRVGDAGGQIVLASDCAPTEIGGLEQRLVSRFSRGLIVDIATPEQDTRVAIAKKKIADRGGELADGVAEFIGRIPIANVRDLSGLVNRILAIQELEGRHVQPDEIPGLASTLEMGTGDEFGEFVDELAQDVATTVELADAPWRRTLREVLDQAEKDGFNCTRIRDFLDRGDAPPDARRLAEQFTREIERLREIRTELDGLGNPWPEAALGVLRDPERLEEAESLLASARELARPFPELPGTPALEELSTTFAPETVASVARILEPEGGSASPLYLWSPAGVGAQGLLVGLAKSFRARSSKGRVALVSVSDFAEDFIRALSSGVAGAWRERWWRAELLLIDRIQDLSLAERAQDELFHLFEAVQRNGGRIALAADRPPARIPGAGERLLARLGGGAVVAVDSDDLPFFDDLLPATDPPSEPGVENGAPQPRFDTVLGANVLDLDASLDAFDVLSPSADAGAATELGTPDELADPGLLDLNLNALEEFDVLTAGATGGDVAAEPGAAAPHGAGTVEPPSTPARPPSRSSKALAGWQPTNEEVVWNWPNPEDLLAEEEVAGS